MTFQKLSGLKRFSKIKKNNQQLDFLFKKLLTYLKLSNTLLWIFIYLLNSIKMYNYLDTFVEVNDPLYPKLIIFDSYLNMYFPKMYVH